MIYKMKNIAASGFIAATLTVPGIMFATPVMADETTYQQMSKEVDQAVNSVGEYTQTKRDQAAQKIKGAMNKMDQEIDQLENQVRDNWNDMTDATREKTKAALKDLRQKRNQLGERFGEMKSGTQESWSELKDGFNEAWNAFKSSWSEAFNSAQTDDGKS